MTFTAASFIFLFAPLALLGAALLRFLEAHIPCAARFRWHDIYLLLASFAFYSWASIEGAAFLGIYIFALWIIASLLHNSAPNSVTKTLGDSRGDSSEADIGLPCSKETSRRLSWLLRLSLVCLIALLAYTKYTAFALSVINDFAGEQLINIPTIFIPLGISFITFSSISYLVDSYRRIAHPGSLIDAALYIAFFPKLISGPIVLWRDFAHQLTHREKAAIDWSYAIDRIVIGLVKKIIIADTFGALIANIQNYGTQGIDTPTAWLIVLLYYFQIYFDFSGYSDIAIGLATACGFRFKENFNFPYISSSITEFWRRWHISLGAWFREYLYIPLGGNRRGTYRTLLNLGIVFLVTGIWHGAGWGYLLWGIAHGVCIIIERLAKDKRWYKAIPKFARWAITQFIVALGWIAFLFGNVSDSAHFVKVLLGLYRFERIPFMWSYWLTGQVILLLIVAMLGAFLLGLPIICKQTEAWMQTSAGQIIKSVVFLALATITFIVWINSSYSPFIYFQY